MCCPVHSLAKEFLSLIDSFDLAQFVNVPTHVHGHTLDLVLSHGLTVCDLEIEDHVISDHKPIVFTVPISFNVTLPSKAGLGYFHQLIALISLLFLRKSLMHLTSFTMMGMVQSISISLILPALIF